MFRVFIKNSTEGLVPGSFLQGCCGSLLWTIYGLSKPDQQLIFANANVVIAIVLILSVCETQKNCALGASFSDERNFGDRLDCD